MHPVSDLAWSDMHAGGPALARKLVDLYFGLFQLILKGSLGRAADAERERQAKKLGPAQHSAPPPHLMGAKKKDRHRNRGLSPADLKKKAEQDRAKVGFFLGFFFRVCLRVQR